MNVGDKVRLTNILPIRKIDGEIWKIVSSGEQGEIRRMLRADGALVGVFFADLNVEVAVSTRDLEPVK